MEEVLDPWSTELSIPSCCTSPPPLPAQSQLSARPSPDPAPPCIWSLCSRIRPWLPSRSCPSSSLSTPPRGPMHFQGSPRKRNRAEGGLRRRVVWALCSQTPECSGTHTQAGFGPRKRHGWGVGPCSSNCAQPDEGESSLEAAAPPALTWMPDLPWEGVLLPPPNSTPTCQLAGRISCIKTRPSRAEPSEGSSLERGGLLPPSASRGVEPTAHGLS